MQRSVRQYLETGALPAEKSSGQEANGKLFGIPDSGLFPEKSRSVPGTPFFDILIDIAIAENQPDECILWYDRLREASGARRSFFLSAPDDKVADFVAGKYPDRSLAFWKERAGRLAAESTPKSYDASVHYLKKIRALMVNLGREEEWTPYIAEVRKANARKKRFLERLDVLEGKKILVS